MISEAIGIPDSILNKPTRLTEEEYAVIKEHTIIGAEILKNITLIDHVKEVARSHHERYDGKGYPDGLKGEELLCDNHCDSRQLRCNEIKENLQESAGISEMIYNEILQSCGKSSLIRILRMYF